MQASASNKKVFLIANVCVQTRLKQDRLIGEWDAWRAGVCYDGCGGFGGGLMVRAYGEGRCRYSAGTAQCSAASQPRNSAMNKVGENLLAQNG
jgi:hypothetical protein